MRNVFVRFVFLASFFVIISCKNYAQDYSPYVADCDFVMDEGAEEYSICGIKCLVMNKSDKNIKSLNLVFYLFDKDGEPATECQSKLEFNIEKDIPAGQSVSFCISLDKYINTIPSENLFVDYVYLSKIEYEDGSTWDDPLGLIAFK